MSEKNLKFEKAIEQLEKIIAGIETGDIGLEDSLAQYEKGVKLIGHCRGILSAAEKRLAELTRDENGDLHISNADKQDDDEAD